MGRNEWREVIHMKRMIEGIEDLGFQRAVVGAV